MFETYSLITLGTLIWGGLNVIKKYYFKDRQVSLDLMTVATMLGIASFCLIAQYLLWGPPEVKSGFLIPFLATTLLNIFILYWELKALKLADASIVSALTGITPLFVVLFSYLMLHELPTSLGITGIVLIVIGVYILNVKSANLDKAQKPQTNLKKILIPFTHLFSLAGARLAVVVALLGAIALNFDKLVVINSNPMIRVGGVSLIVAVVILAKSLYVGEWQTINKKYFWPMFGLGVFSGLSSVMINWAFLFSIVPYVGALKRLQIVWTVIFAAYFLKEKNLPSKALAAVIIIIGAILIAF